jgi:signal transduction histidine kinase/HAMP domain-containing protein
MIGIRQKLMLGFGGLLAVLAVVGVLTMARLDALGQALSLALTENYRSVVACQEMKDALAQMNDGLFLLLNGQEADALSLISAQRSRFAQALAVELGNITLPGEGEKAAQLKSLFAHYAQHMGQLAKAEQSNAARLQLWLKELRPLAQQLRQTAQEVLLLNQANMEGADSAARRLAATARHRLLTAILISALIALLYAWLVQHWILRPISRMTELANEIRQGRLDLALAPGGDDELGQLAAAFNAMTAALRQARKEERSALLRSRRATEDVFKTLPDAVAVFDLAGRVEIATETAAQHFGLRPGVQAEDAGCAWLPPLLRQALAEQRTVEREPLRGCVQQFINGREYFFQPSAAPLPLSAKQGEPSGVAVFLKDMTLAHEQQELKRSAAATVAHQLRTPLTSMRMAVHLLLEEQAGPLTEQQADLLVSARDESERLAAILDSLIDISRMEAGKLRLNAQPAAPRLLLAEACESFAAEAKDRGIALHCEAPDELPDVLADAAKIGQVFANLLANALRFTGAGGEVRLRATADEAQGKVLFLVEDSGAGIPAEELGHLYEQFYRAPGQDERSGAGLGLAIVKEIVQSHGGEVGAESEIGRGSIFRFSLPVVKA